MSTGTQISIHDVVNDYITEIRKLCIKVKFTSEEFRKYIYKPKLLCYDIYGNPELYFIILLINDMADVKEFCIPVVDMLKKKDMDTVVSYIFNTERVVLNEYNNRNS